MISLDDVLAARATIGDRVHRTPTLTSATLSRQVGAPVHLKAELFQRTGSFKPRGVLNKLASLSAVEKARGVIGISAGNHAQALAYASTLEGIDALVVMWEDASEQKIAATKAYGATVDLEARTPAEAFGRLADLIEETGRVLVHPFDDPLIMAGQGTVGLELMEDVPDAHTVVVPVGGGGLVSGVATAVKGIRPETRVVAVEPELAPSLHDALNAGRSVPVEPRSIADGLNAPFAGENAVEVCRERVDEVVLVSEDEIEDAFRLLYTRAKLACEPAGAASAAAIVSGKIALETGSPVVLVVSGGNVAVHTASAILAGR
ncbi:MAG TPA: threonine/serine dehydratase [Gaiellaceae bacterium]|jgi:threonine dehydratase|nr:threonine/serine dehydratase [Gaiellaceae bacterium]